MGAAMMERALKHLGAAGVQVYSNAANKPLDLPEFQPIFEMAAATDTPVRATGPTGRLRPNKPSHPPNRHPSLSGLR